jgi:hypothetical protein
LRQILLSDISCQPSEALLRDYENLYSNSEHGCPDYEEFLISICSKFSSLSASRVVVLFDALDECDPSYQDDVLHLIETLNESEIFVYVTTRDHLDTRIKFNLSDTRSLRICASDRDIRNYLEQRFQKVRVKFEDGVKDRIIDRIAAGGNGM